MIIYKVSLQTFRDTASFSPVDCGPSVQQHYASRYALTRPMQDLVSGDEIISDSYDLIEKDDAVYEVNCKKIIKRADNFGQCI